jgi:hypothetical protein
MQGDQCLLAGRHQSVDIVRPYRTRQHGRGGTLHNARGTSPLDKRVEDIKRHNPDVGPHSQDAVQPALDIGKAAACVHVTSRVTLASGG